MLYSHARASLLTALEHITHGSLTLTLPEGTRYEFTGTEEGATASLYIHDARALTQLALHGDVGFAEGYRDGLWDTEDIALLLLFGLHNAQALETCLYGSALSRLGAQLLYLFRSNTRKGSRRNIHAHYDLGNDFYKLWLDPSMSYSSALFTHEKQALEQAQHHKYDRILDQLGASSGRLLEVGCGWGGFAERALDKGDFAYRGITISEQQYHYARERLPHQAAVQLEDYRLQKGRFDQIVSIEMFEAVGERFWPVYFSKIKQLLADKGKAVVQTITIDDPLFERYRKSSDMIRSFIFPGGMLPSPSRFTHEAQKAGLKVTDRFAFGQDYATTLRHWLENFDRALPQIRALGFDGAFIRLWRFYLSYCIASFTAGRTDVMQLELQHA